MQNKKTKKQKSKNFYEVDNPFFNKKYNNKTYGKITNSIIKDLIALKEKFPGLTAIDSEARYNLVKGTENFLVTFQYNNPKTGAIDWSVEMKEYKKPQLPEGKTPITLDMLPDYAFLGKIGDILVTLEFKTNSTKIKNEIISILKKHGAIKQNKKAANSIYLPFLWGFAPSPTKGLRPLETYFYWIIFRSGR